MDLRRNVSDLADTGELSLRPRRISYASLLVRKRQALTIYASQMNRDIMNCLLAYALKVGRLVCAAERVWEAEPVGATPNESKSGEAEDSHRFKPETS